MDTHSAKTTTSVGTRPHLPAGVPPGLPLMKRAQKSVVAVRSKMGGSPEGKVDPSRERGMEK